MRKNRYTSEIKTPVTDNDYNRSEAVESGQSPPRKKKKRKKKHYLLKFLFLLALCVGVYYFFTSSFFNIKTIKVENNKNFTAKEICKIAGARKNVNLFKYKTGKGEDAFSLDPYFEKVEISRLLPHTLVINVKERLPIGAVLYNKDYYLIDKEGMLLEKYRKVPKLTVLKGMNVKKAQIGEILEVKEKNTFEDTLEMLSSMEKNGVYFKKIDVSQVIIKAYIYDKLYCRGTPANVYDSIVGGRLEKVIYDLQGNGIKRGVINIGANNYCSFSPALE